MSATGTPNNPNTIVNNVIRANYQLFDCANRARQWSPRGLSGMLNALHHPLWLQT